MEIILTPFAWLLKAFYSFCGSYGLALVFFALVVKVVLFPLSLKGKRSMIQMNILQGQMQKLQKQYGKDRQRYNLEVQKLYQKEKVNPMGGCLWSFIPLIILMILYPIIREPIHYMMGINDANSLNAIAQAVGWSTQAVDMGWIKEATDTFTNSGYNQLYLASLINADNLAAVQQAVTAAGGVGANVFSINFSLFGLVDLSQVPQLQFWTIAGGFGLFLLPVISAVSGVFFSLISMKTNAINKQSAQANNGTAKTMLIISPLISLWIGFAMPAALCLYWVANNVLSMIQEFLCSRILKKDYEEAARKQAEREQQEKEEEIPNLKNGLNFARKVLATGECDVLILDEVLGLPEREIATLEELHSLLEAAENTDLIFTGIRLYPEMLEWAYEVYEISVLKESE